MLHPPGSSGRRKDKPTSGGEFDAGAGQDVPASVELGEFRPDEPPHDRGRGTGAECEGPGDLVTRPGCVGALGEAAEHDARLQGHPDRWIDGHVVTISVTVAGLSESTIDGLRRPG